MVCDFRVIYGLSWWGEVESGDVDEVDLLVAGLKLRPDSLYRATLFTQNPPPKSTGDRPSMSWHNWSQDTALLLEIRNMLVPKHRLAGPPTAAENAPTTPIEALQQLRRA